MSKISESFELSLDIDAVWEVIRGVVESGDWTIHSVDRASFFVREPSDMLSRLFRHPTRVAIFLHEQSEHETRIALHGSIFGFGPMQKARVRKVLARLRHKLDAAFKAAFEAAANPEAEAGE